MRCRRNTGDKTKKDRLWIVATFFTNFVACNTMFVT